MNKWRLVKTGEPIPHRLDSGEVHFHSAEVAVTIEADEVAFGAGSIEFYNRSEHRLVLALPNNAWKEVSQIAGDGFTIRS